MFEFDDLFERRDPFGAFGSSVSLDTGGTCLASLEADKLDRIWSLRGLNPEALRASLLSRAHGIDLRSASVNAAHQEAKLVDVREVF